MLVEHEGELLGFLAQVQVANLYLDLESELLLFAALLEDQKHPKAQRFRYFKLGPQRCDIDCRESLIKVFWFARAY